MILQMRQLGKPFHAKVTDVRFFAGVDQFVAVKLGRCWELFTAVDTFVASVIDDSNGRRGQAFGCIEMQAAAAVDQSPVSAV